MAEQDKLAILRNRLLNQMKRKETELKDLHRKMSAIDEVYNLLIEEGNLKEQVDDVKVTKEKYKNVGLQDAILDCINNGPPRLWTRPEVIKVLRQNGIKTRSPNARNFYSVVAVTLNRLVTQKNIAVEKGKRGKVFKKIKAEGEQNNKVVDIRQVGS